VRVSPDASAPGMDEREDMGILDLTPATTDQQRRTPTEILFTGALVVGPVVYLLVDSLYAARGWDDADAGGIHVIGAVLYGFVLLRLASWARGWLAAGMVAAAVVGTAGNVAYGFNTINVSLGGVDLVDTSGPGAIIKPLGLVFPLALLIGAVILRRIGRVRVAVLLGLAGIAWPVAHIGNIAWLAVVVNLVLVVALVPLAWTVDPQRGRA
jgi:hypothetical protein